MSKFYMGLVLIAGLISSAAASATTCSQAVQKCIAVGVRKPGIESMCQAAGQSCMKDGEFVGPVSGIHWRGLVKR